MKQHTTKTNQVQIKSSALTKNLDAKSAIISSKIIPLIETNDIAWQLLQYAAWLKADNMPTTVLLHAISENYSGFNDGIRTLEKLSLITHVEINDFMGIAIDSAVQDLCFKFMSTYPNNIMTPDSLILSLCQVYDELLPDVDLQVYELQHVTWQREWDQRWYQDMYLPHVEALFEFINSRSVKVSIDKIMVKLHSKLASIYAYALEPTLRDLKKSLDHSYEALKMFELAYPGKEQSDLICILNNLSTAYQFLGNSEKSQQYHEQAVKVYGTQLYNEAVRLNKMGDDCFSSRNYKGAIMAHEQALKIYQEFYGKNYPHSDVITALTKLSNAHCFSGNNKEALKQAVMYSRQALKICENLYGKEHRDFAVALNNLGLVYHRSGSQNASIMCHEEALKIYEKLNEEGYASPIAITLENLSNANLTKCNR